MEGPQTRALAEHLNELITGKPVERILVPEGRWQANMMLLNCVGQVIQRVRSHGKWLFFDFSHGVSWMCQLITRAQWRIVTRRETDARTPRAAASRARKAAREPLITLILRAAGNSADSCAEHRPVTAVLTGHPIFYIVPSETVRRHPEIALLGPDPLATPTFYDDFPYRLRQTPGRTVAAALLDQEVVAGLGNALKCEVLFAMRFAPPLRVGALLASQIDQLAKTIVSLAALATTTATQAGSAARRHASASHHRVHDRAGLACPCCGNEIAVDRSGQDGHLTWHCPVCQKLGQEGTLFGEAHPTGA